MRRETRLMHYGRPSLPGPANPPIVRASTILHETVASFRQTKERREKDPSVLSYGRRGTTTAHELSAAICDLESGETCVLFPTGVAAVSGGIAPFVRTGDHLLVVDTVFPATRSYCEHVLRPMGVTIDYFPWNTTDLSSFVKPETKAVFVESPGSITLEVMDLPALCGDARARGLLVIADNTYGSGWLYNPLQLGCDASIIAGTKYVGGHADAMLGAVTANGAAAARLRDHAVHTGQTVGPDEAFACIRGLRTLALRMERHQQNAIALATWFQHQGQVLKVLHPALPDHPGADFWKRDANGSNGLLSVVFAEGFDADAFIDRLRLFAIGSSWGGFESLALPASPDTQRKYSATLPKGPLVRFHAGLEHIDDLIEDLDASIRVA